MDKRLYEITMIMSQVHKTDISIYDEAFLAKTLERRQAVRGIKSSSEYCDYLRGNSSEAVEFFNALHITFSQFFREPLPFAILEQLIIPSIISGISAGSEIRVWSAGCASGQEAYSIAMLLDECISASKKNLLYRIFATDISNNALSVAEDGVYNSANIQNVTVKQFHKYFIGHGEKFAITPKLKQNISFSYFDLLDPASANPPESIFGDFDIIFCCNLLLYYKADSRLSILSKLEKSMSAKGFFIVGEVERAIVENAASLRSFPASTAAFQKNNQCARR